VQTIRLPSREKSPPCPPFRGPDQRNVNSSPLDRGHWIVRDAAHVNRETAGSWRLRLVGALAALAWLTTGTAHASSFVTIAPPSSTPSIVALGDPLPAIAAAPAEQTAAMPDIVVPLAFPIEPARPRIVTVSASIIAFDQPVPSVSNEKVAAVPRAVPRGWGPTPRIMRGGIVDAPASQGTEAAPAPRPKPPTRRKRQPDPQAPTVPVNAPATPVPSSPRPNGAEQPAMAPFSAPPEPPTPQPTGPVLSPR
jgi:hypothetical protein